MWVLVIGRKTKFALSIDSLYKSLTDVTKSSFPILSLIDISNDKCLYCARLKALPCWATPK
jgi:hypothetical protein